MRPARSNPKTMHRAGQLRKTPTPAEDKFWSYLRARKLNGVRFRRQHAVGKYIVDFCSPKHKLIVELDGSPHVLQTKEAAARTIFLESQGYRLLRFWNSQVTDDIDGVGRTLLNALNST